MIPYRDFSGFAAACLHWPPDHFWSSTPHEFFAAIDGWRMSNDPDFSKRQRFKKLKEGWERKQNAHS